MSEQSEQALQRRVALHHDEKPPQHHRADGAKEALPLLQ